MRLRDLYLILLSPSTDSRQVQSISHMPIFAQYQCNSTGFHAKTPEPFRGALHEALTLPSEEELALRHRARTWAVHRFSEEEFEKGWNESGWKKWLPS